MIKKNTTKKITEDNQIPLLVRSGQWKVVERTEEYIFAVCPKNRQDDRIDEQKKLIDQLTKKLRSQDKQMKEQKECIRSQDERIKSQDARINLQDGQIKEMNECICSQDEQIQAQNKLITELQAKWEAHEGQFMPIDQSEETNQASNGKPAVLMTDICNTREETFVFGSKIKRKEISAIYTQNTLKKAPSDAWDVSAEKDKSVMAWTCKDADSDTYILYLAGDGEIYANPDSRHLFAHYENLIKADFTHLKTDLVTDMYYMFGSCRQLQVLDVSKWDVSNVKDMSWMFYNCSQLQTLDVSRWDVCNVKDMSWMFSFCNAVDHMKEGELSSWKLHPSVDLENFCKGTKFEKTPTALFQIP